MMSPLRGPLFFPEVADSAHVLGSAVLVGHVDSESGGALADLHCELREAVHWQTGVGAGGILPVEGFVPFSPVGPPRKFAPSIVSQNQTWFPTSESLMHLQP